MKQKYKVFINNKPLYLTQSQSFYNCFEGKRKRFKSKRTLEKAIETLENEPLCKAYVIYHWDLDELFYHFRRIFKYVHAAGGLVQNEKGESLIIKRKGKWDIPKGKLDKGENPEETAVREIEEECGIKDLELDQFITHTYHTYRSSGQNHLKKTWWYTLHSNYDGELTPQIEEDITEVNWVANSELDSLRSNTYISIHTVLDAFKNLA